MKSHKSPASKINYSFADPLFSLTLQHCSRPSMGWSKRSSWRHLPKTYSSSSVSTPPTSRTWSVVWRAISRPFSNRSPLRSSVAISWECFHSISDTCLQFKTSDRSSRASTYSFSWIRRNFMKVSIWTCSRQHQLSSSWRRRPLWLNFQWGLPIISRRPISLRFLNCWRGTYSVLRSVWMGQKKVPVTIRHNSSPNIRSLGIYREPPGRPSWRRWIAVPRETRSSGC